MKKIIIILLTFILTDFLFAQIAQGPASGTVASGFPVYPSLFAEFVSSGVVFPKPPRNKFPILSEPLPEGMFKPLAPEGSNYMIDPIIQNGKTVDSSFYFKSFEGIPQTNSIPPDCYMAVGPLHIITTVNTSFRISSKDGKTMKTIEAGSWFSNLFPGLSPFDPKVSYDQFSNRWVMVWLNLDETKKTSYFLISVSENSNAMGKWWNYLLPGNVNGSNSIQSWADYQGVGYDDKAIYLTANNWQFAGSLDYAKIRFLKKSELYANNGGPVTFTDFWNILIPNLTNRATYLRPARQYDSGNSFYFVSLAPNPKTFIVIYKLSDVLSNPTLTGITVPVTQYSSAPNAKQKDGGSLLIEAGGNFIQNEPVFKNGLLHIAHSIASGTGKQYSSIRYLCINPQSQQVQSDIAMGADGYWHFYPALAVDSIGNVIITYSRSGLNEYAGAFYTVKYAGSNILAGSRPLQTGKANYVKDFSSGRNRWGDYMGAWTDPTDENNFWIFTEYVSSKDTWGTYVGGIRLKPFDKPYISVFTDQIYFGNIEIGKSSNNYFIKIVNFGQSDLAINTISKNSNSFKIINNLNYPYSIAPFDSLLLEIKFEPVDTGFVTDMLSISTNAVNSTLTKIDLSGLGYAINPAKRNTIYSIVRSNNIPNLATINPDGSVILVGQTGSNNITSLAINDLDSNEQIFGISSYTSLVRINSTKADFYRVVDFKCNFKFITFESGQLYGLTDFDDFYKINLSNGDTTFLYKFKISPACIVLNPQTKDIWATVGSTSTIKDKIYKIKLETGDTTFVGQTGLGVVTNSMAFDAENNLYGIKGTPFQNSSLFTIDKQSGLASNFKTIAYKGIGTICILPKIPSAIENEKLSKQIKDFFLSQNFPNPFNPNTIINYQLPVSNFVTLKVYDVLGREVENLVNEQKSAGSYNIEWNAGKYSSGIYYYELRAGNYREIKKMSLVK